MHIYSGTYKDLCNTKPEPNSIAIILHHPEDGFLGEIKIPEGFAFSKKYKMGHNSEYEDAAKQIVQDFLKQFPYLEKVGVFDWCNLNRAPAVKIGLEYIIGQNKIAAEHEKEHKDHIPQIVNEIKGYANYFKLN